MQDNYTKIDNRFIDEVMQTLKSSELACCMAIFRKTAGWGKHSAAVSVDTISEITGIKRRHTIITALNALESKEIIKATKTAGKTTVYGFCYQLKQSFKTSAEKRTSDGNSTRTENDTGTSVEKRTSTSAEKRTSSSIYKEKEKKEKEKEREGNFYRLHKKAIDRHIQTVINNSGNIHNEAAYRKTMIKQFIKEDQATIIEFEAWLPVYQCEELQERHGNNYFEAVSNNERFRGELLRVEINEDGKPSIQLRNTDEDKTRSYWFHNITVLENFLENGGNG